MISTGHPALEPLMPLWAREELGFVHAVATPCRDKRSHFDGQDLLEAGTGALNGARDGWLNRILQVMPGVSGRTVFAIGNGEMLSGSDTAQGGRWECQNPRAARRYQGRRVRRRATAW